jgi:hypothetical protein
MAPLMSVRVDRFSQVHQKPSSAIVADSSAEARARGAGAVPSSDETEMKVRHALRSYLSLVVLPLPWAV